MEFMATMKKLVEIFYNIKIEPTFLKLLISTLLCSIVGIEREIRQKPAGLRTNILIGLGSTVFTIISYQMALYFGGDPTRIAAQIITGIGFIGGGVIVQSRMSIKGITTAATIFVVASIGMAVGADKFGVAIAVTIISVVVLYLLGYFENFIEKRNLEKEITLKLEDKDNLNELFKYLSFLNIEVKSIKYERMDDETVRLKITVSARNNLELEKCDLLCDLITNEGKKNGKK